MAFLEFGLILTFLLIVAAVVIGAFFIWGLKHALLLAVNSVIGFFALYGVQAWLLPGLVINIWSILLVAALGLAGLLLVVLFHFLGFWF